MDVCVDVDWLRSIVAEWSTTDPGPLELSTPLTDIGLVGLDLYACIGAIEDALGIDFPADLLPVLATVDDLLYFTSVKVEHKLHQG